MPSFTPTTSRNCENLVLWIKMFDQNNANMEIFTCSIPTTIRIISKSPCLSRTASRICYVMRRMYRNNFLTTLSATSGLPELQFSAMLAISAQILSSKTSDFSTQWHSQSNNRFGECFSGSCYCSMLFV